MSNIETKKYLNIMIESLEKKKKLLDMLLSKTSKQSDCIAGKDYENADWEQFQVLMIEKDEAIDKIDELDSGFDQVFSRVKNELDNNKAEYVVEIKKLQELITSLTDIGVKISATEERNRQDIERIMTATKAGIGKARKNMKATSGYITSMYGNKANVESMKIDSKH